MVYFYLLARSQREIHRNTHYRAYQPQLCFGFVLFEPRLRARELHCFFFYSLVSNIYLIDNVALNVQCCSAMSMVIDMAGNRGKLKTEPSFCFKYWNIKIEY